MLKYRRQTSPQTLKNGLQEYHKKYPHLLQSPELAAELGELFKHHDVIHVVFGCDISFHDEILTDVWSIFGSTISLMSYLSYLKYPEITDIVKEIGLIKAFVIFLGTVLDAVRVFLRTLQMTKKWPWKDYEIYLDKPLCEIRAEFGIKVL